MKRKALIIFATSLIIVLATSTIVATAQAWWFPKPKTEYVGYSLEGISGPPIATSTDASDAPNIVVESTLEWTELTITINDVVYSYPEDFDRSSTTHMEFNVITGEGFARTESTLTFNMPGHPTLTFVGVSRISGLHMTPDGTLLTPQEVRNEGNIDLTGSRRFSNVDGIALSQSYYLQPDYTQLYHHQFGLIKGW
jgi:hypothetical protein